MTNGERALVGLSDRLIRVLPPAMLVLVIFNVLFLGLLVYLVQHNADARNALLAQILTSCLHGATQ